MLPPEGIRVARYTLRITQLTRNASYVTRHTSLVTRNTPTFPAPMLELRQVLHNVQVAPNHAAEAEAAQQLQVHLHAKPQTPNPKPQTPNPKPQTPNPKPQTPNPKPQTPTASTPHAQPVDQPQVYLHLVPVAQLGAQSVRRHHVHQPRLQGGRVSRDNVAGRWNGWVSCVNTRMLVTTHVFTHAECHAAWAGVQGLGLQILKPEAPALERERTPVV